MNVNPPNHIRKTSLLLLLETSASRKVKYLTIKALKAHFFLVTCACFEETYLLNRTSLINIKRAKEVSESLLFAYTAHIFVTCRIPTLLRRRLLSFVTALL